MNKRRFGFVVILVALAGTLSYAQFSFEYSFFLDVRNSTAKEPSIGSHKGVFYFAGYDQVYGTELWRSDGTEAGTYMLLDMNPAGNSSNFGSPVVVDDLFYFSAAVGLTGYRLVTTDGTVSGTRVIYPKLKRNSIAADEERIYFTGETENNRYALMAYEVASDSIVLIWDIRNDLPAGEVDVKTIAGKWLLLGQSVFGEPNALVVYDLETGERRTVEGFEFRYSALSDVFRQPTIFDGYLFLCRGRQDKGAGAFLARSCKCIRRTIA